MEYFSTNEIGRIFTLRLDKDDYLLEGINALIEKEGIRDAVIVSAIGTLSSCVLHMVMTTGYPVIEHFEHWDDKPLELSSIDGIIANGKPHLHATVSDHEKAYSGHLEEGCRVLYLAEIVIVEVKGLDLKRIPNEANTLQLKGKKENGA